MGEPDKRWTIEACDESGFPVASVPKYPKDFKSPQEVFQDRLDAEEILRRMDLEEKLISGKAFVTKDSGKRHEETTGAVRDTNDGKGRFDLIPPVPMKRLALLCQRGAEKYGENNWRKGINLPRYLDSALRHINDYQSGDRSEDHLIATAWNLFAFVHTEDRIKKGELPKSLDKFDYLGGDDATR